MVACQLMFKLGRLLPLTRCTSWLPEPRRESLAVHLAGRTVGKNGRRVGRARKHLQLCFPHLNRHQREQYLINHFIHRYRLILSLGWLRYAPLQDISASITDWQGVDLLQNLRANGRGVIVATPHFGDWERFNLAMGMHVRAAVLYKPASDPAAARWLHQLRSRTGVQPVPVTSSGIREVLKRLRGGGIVGILPDQAPRHGHGIHAPFFRQATPTMTLIHRLIQKTGCAVCFGACWHTRGGYRLTITPAAMGMDNAGPGVSAAVLNQGVEEIIYRAPEQYLWTYKRWG